MFELVCSQFVSCINLSAVQHLFITTYEVHSSSMTLPSKVFGGSKGSPPPKVLMQCEYCWPVGLSFSIPTLKEFMQSGSGLAVVVAALRLFTLTPRLTRGFASMNVNGVEPVDEFVLLPILLSSLQTAFFTFPLINGSSLGQVNIISSSDEGIII